MKIKALRSSYGDKGRVSRGQVIDLPDDKAKQLVKRGLYTDVISETPKKAEAGKSKARK